MHLLMEEVEKQEGTGNGEEVTHPLTSQDRQHMTKQELFQDRHHVTKQVQEGNHFWSLSFKPTLEEPAQLGCPGLQQ